jgi:FkbM family methyltransferase
MRLRGWKRLRFEVKRLFGRWEAWRFDLYEWSPNYAVLAGLPRGAIVVDVGVGDTPDFSRELADRLDAQCWIVDPTRKHRDILRRYAELDGRFKYLCVGLSAKSGRLEFFESADNVSGSFLATHRNIRGQPSTRYEVLVVSLADLLAEVGGRIDVLKLDLEGAEFELLSAIDSATIAAIGQIFVEFHDGTVPEFTETDRSRAIHRIENCGFRSIVFNGRDVLFIRDPRRASAVEA